MSSLNRKGAESAEKGREREGVVSSLNRKGAESAEKEREREKEKREVSGWEGGHFARNN